jgi:Phage integrase, N-terminal SAM-like domain
VISRRANGEGSIFPYRNGFAAYVWITTPSSKRQPKYVYGRSRQIVHSRWVDLTRKAARGLVVTKVPTVGQFLHRWLEDTVAPNLAPLTCATYESHVKNYNEPGIGSLRLDRLRVADIQPWLNCLATQCQCCAQGKDARRLSAARHGAVPSGSAVIGWLHRAQSRTLEPSCVQG